MREIKFRIWDNTNKCFVSNTTKISPNADTTNCIFRDRIIQGTFLGLVFGYYDKTVIFSEQSDFSIDGYEIHSLAERFIIQEYTGVKDCKEHDIYEGDIIEFELNPFETIKGSIEFDYGAFYIKTNNKEYDKIILCDMNFNLVEVTGNILENKELLR